MRPPNLDIGLAVVFAALAMSEIVVNSSVRTPLEHVLLSALPLATLAWRRQYPELVTLVVVVSNLVANPNLEFSIVLSLVVCGFTVGFDIAAPRSYVGLAVALLPFVAGLFAQNGFVPSDLAAVLVFVVGPWVVGTALRQRTDLAHQAVARAEERAREQERQAREAAAAERNRIARELHDIVSHSISVVTIQTQAVRRRLGPDHAAEAADLAMVETTAREALQEMRRLFGVLRTEGEAVSLTPQPGLGELRRLVESVPIGGPAVHLVEEGTPVPLPPGLDLAAYRIAQEGLTNALRHAHASQITVAVSFGAAEVAVAVFDDGRGLARSAANRDDAGHGLVGIRERVALYQGTVELEELPAGGTRLRARLPLSAPEVTA